MKRSFIYWSILLFLIMGYLTTFFLPEGKHALGSGAATAVDYYVDVNNGTDDPSHGTSSSGGAWKTLHYAIDRINAKEPGAYVLHVASGDYNGANGEDLSRTIVITQSNLAILGEGSSRPILQGGGSWTTALEVAKGTDHVTIDHVEIAGFNSGIIISGNNVFVQTSYLHDNRGSAILISPGDGKSGNTAREGEFFEKDSIIFILGRNVNNIPRILGNEISNNGVGVSIKPFLNPIIEKNSIHDNQDGVLLYGGTIRNNLIYDNLRSAISADGNASIFHNTLAGSGVEGSIGVTVSNAAGVPEVRYNIIAGFGIGIKAVGGAILDYNDLWNNTSQYDGIAPGPNEISQDPLFTDPGSSVFTLQKGSPCIDFVPAGSGHPVTDDYNGSPRPKGKGYDIGAYETAGTHSLLPMASAGGCTYASTPLDISWDDSGGTATITVTASPDTCSWTASTLQGWITINNVSSLSGVSASSGTGSGTISYTIDSNTPCSDARSGAIDVSDGIDGSSTAITQGGYWASNLYTPYPSSGGSGSIAISASAGCPWTASVSASGAGWITIIDPSSGSGAGTGVVSYSLAPNIGPARSGQILFTGSSTFHNDEFVIDQDSGCSFTLLYFGQPVGGAWFDFTGGGASLDVIPSSPDCSWTATSDQSWITVGAPGSGTGNGSLDIAVDPDPSPGPVRSGTVAVGDAMFTILQGNLVYVNVAGDPAGGSVDPVAQIVDQGGTATINVALNPGYTASVSDGSLAGDTWTIDNITSSLTVTITFNPPGTLSVTPPEGLDASGIAGGPFAPPSKIYTLSNTGGNPIDWSVSSGQDWVTLSPVDFDGGASKRKREGKTAFKRGQPDSKRHKDLSGAASELTGSLNPAQSVMVEVSINDDAKELDAGSYGDTVTFADTTNSTNISRAVTLIVNNPLPVTTDISPASKTVGDAGFSLAVNGTNFVSTSLVKFAGSERITTFVSSTQLTADIPESDLISAGTFDISVYNPAPGGGWSNPQTFTVNKTDTVTSLISNVNPSTYGQWVTFTATVDIPGGGAASGKKTEGRKSGRKVRPIVLTSVTPAGAVEFFDGGTSLGTVVLSDGSASLSTGSLTAGSHSITAVYTGTGDFNGSTSSVLPQGVNKSGTTTIVLSDNNPSTQGQPVTFRATVNPNVTISGAPTGTVTFKDGAAILSTRSLSGGQASFGTSSLATGSHSITAEYGGDANFNGSISPILTQTVNAALGSLSVTPLTGLDATGFQGGPFTPSSKVYTLQNTGESPFDWSASKGQPWVSLSSPASGTLGPGASVQVTVSINSNTNSLGLGSYTDMAIFTNLTNDNGSTTRGVVLKVTACNYTIDPGSASYSASGGTGSISVTASASNCSWDAGSNVSWISIQSVTGGVGKVSGKRPKGGAAYLGSGTVNYAVSTNTGPARDGTLTVAGQTVTIHQESGCAYSIDPASTLHASAGGTGSVNVTAGTGCIWTAVSDASWITVTPGWSGTGNGTVNYSVSADTGSARDGTIAIAGQTFTIHQEAATYNLIVNVTGSGTVRFEPPGPYAPGTKVIVYFEPTPGSHVSDVIVDGVSIGGVYAVTFTDMSMNHTINVIFE